MMRVLVCGGIDYRQPNLVKDKLDWLDHETRISVVIEGGASGVDCYAAEWADANGVPLKTFHADWKAHGKAAGPIRNQQMLDEGRPDLVVAFPGGRGTTDMVARARRAGVPVREFHG